MGLATTMASGLVEAPFCITGGVLCTGTSHTVPGQNHLFGILTLFSFTNGKKKNHHKNKKYTIKCRVSVSVSKFIY